MSTSESNKKCCVEGCESSGTKWPGVNELYCFDHYKDELKKRLLDSYEKFDGEQHKDLARNLATLSEYNPNAYFLTRAKIRDRTFNYIKIPEGLLFFIVRHLNAWHEDRVTKSMLTCYSVDISSLKIVEIASLYYNNDALIAIRGVINYTTEQDDEYLIHTKTKKHDNIVKFYIYNYPLLKQIKSKRAKTRRAQRIKEFMSKILIILEGCPPFKYGHTLAMHNKSK